MAVPVVKPKRRVPFQNAKGPRAIQRWRRKRPFKRRVRKNVTPEKKKKYMRIYYRMFKHRILQYKKAWYKAFGKQLMKKYRQAKKSSGGSKSSKKSMKKMTAKKSKGRKMTAKRRK